MTPVHPAINYVEMTVTDMDAAQHFYGTAFGWRFTMRRPKLASRHPRVTARSAVSVSARTSSPVDRLVHLYSDDLEATVAAVKDAGGTIAEEPYAFPGGRRFTFFDRSGNRLGVWSTT
jgi:uncharacterized protein